MRRQLSQKDASSTAFLDKFLGKTTKIGKAGISGVIAQARTETMKQFPIKAKRPSIYRSQRSFGDREQEQRKFNMDDAIKQPQRSKQSELVSSRIHKQSSSSGQYISYFSRNSSHSQDRPNEIHIENGRSAHSDVRVNQFNGVSKKNKKSKFLYETLLNEDALRQYQLLSLMEQKFKNRI